MRSSGGEVIGMSIDTNMVIGRVQINTIPASIFISALALEWEPDYGSRWEEYIGSDTAQTSFVWEVDTFERSDSWGVHSIASSHAIPASEG